MRPDYGFIVTPWSIRGYESVHGAITTVIGLGLLGGVLLVLSPKAEEQSAGTWMVVYMVAAPTIIAAVFAREPDGGATTWALDFNPVMLILAGLLVGAILAKPGQTHLKPRIKFLSTRAGSIVGGLAAYAIAFAVLSVFLMGNRVELVVWVWVLLITGLPAILAVITAPRELAATRMLILVSAVALPTVALASGAIRQTLIRVQAELGATSQYKDTQVTSGYLWAVAGIGLVILSAIGVWAKRRDFILNVTRARRQREAAEESSREIEAALGAAGQPAAAQ